MTADAERRPERRLEATDDCWAAVSIRVADGDAVERCTRCGHVLTAAVSIARGTGPVCASRIAAHALADAVIA